MNRTEDRTKTLIQEAGKWILELEDQGEIVNRLRIDIETAKRSVPDVR